MLGLLNWPPSRGANPHTHDWKLTPGAAAKDLPAPKPQTPAVAEKNLIDSLEAGVKPEPPSKAEWSRMRRLKPRKKPLLAGMWHVWYQVDAVAALTLAQADDIVRACPCKGERKHDHFDNWWRYEPRPLWVDITYPLTRGVRLLVKPLVRESLPCKTCVKEVGRERDTKQSVMSPGYFLWTVAKEYERIYKEHKKYGVWGHGLEDLGFERITIRKDGVVDLFIGS